MYKKFIIAIMCIAMLLSLAACSKETARQTDGTSNQAETSPTIDTSLKEPSTPTEGPITPTDDPTSPTDDPTFPTDEPNAPTEDPTIPTDDPNEPTEDPTIPTDDPTSPTDDPTFPTDDPNKPVEGPKAVFRTEDIIRITFYAYYGDGTGSDVPTENMSVITAWLGSFTVGEKAPDLLPPGTNTYFVEIEYADGTVVKEGLDVIVIDDTLYLLDNDTYPD